MNNNQPVIAHINDAFFQLTETFIYHYVSGLKHYNSHCLGWKFVNPHNFVFPKEQKHNISASWPLFGPVYEYIMRRFFEADPVAEKKAGAILKKLKPVLLHAHFGFNGYFVLPLKKRLDVPMVTTFYGMDMSILPERPRWKKRYQSLFQDGDLFLVEGPNMRSSLASLGCPEQRIKIQRIAIPVRSIRFKARMPKKNRDKIILLFAGRFVEKKGLLYALKALTRVKVSHKNCEFQISADGPLKQMVL
jgi:colanic acid/amylovoran biosynthesis glycosyltransferase